MFQANFTLEVSGFTAVGSVGDSLAGHNGHYFSTPDRDQDVHPGNCAAIYTAGWW